MTQIIRFTEARCTNCHLCELYCSLAFGEPGVVKFQPAIARIRVAQNEDDTKYVAHVCFQCADPACMNACPTDAITKNATTGMVEVDPDACIGCEMCVEVCEFDCIFLVNNIAVKCQVCDDPLCVRACAAKALEVGEADAEYVERTEELYREVRL